MSQELQSKSNEPDLAEFKKIFGPPPLLTTESIEAYDAILTRFLECIRPEDFVVQMLIKDLANHEWEVLRCMRHKTWAIERKSGLWLGYQERRQKLEAQRKAELVQHTERLDKPATDPERIGELESFDYATIKDVDEIFVRTDEELAHARGFELGIEYYERLDKLLHAAIIRRNDCLDQITHYREHLGHRLRQVSDAIIDAEFKTIDEGVKPAEAPLVPSKEETP
jgi:hypothetical protein